MCQFTLTKRTGVAGEAWGIEVMESDALLEYGSTGIPVAIDQPFLDETNAK
jgi:hypothetical protein